MITLKELSFSYSRKKEVLDRINLEVGSGHICGLLGKNGEGKTTLLNLLSGQIFPDQGSCLVLEEIPSERNARFLQQIFLLPEEISMPEVTAIEYIKMYAAFYPTFRDDICKACVESFEINLSDRLSKMSRRKKHPGLPSVKNCRLLCSWHRYGKHSVRPVIRPTFRQSRNCC